MGQDGQMMGGQTYAYSQDGGAQGAQYWSQDGRRWNQGSCGIEGCDEPREDHACGDQATGECWCKYVHYQPCYYYTKRCVTENKYCTKKCCRQVPQCYEVQRCRMFHSTILKHAHVMFHNIMMCKSAFHVKNGFATNIANTLLATTTNTFVVSQIAQLLALSNNC